MIQATFLGHAAVQLSDGSTTILIDPFISGNPQATVKADELMPDFIVITHGHADHLGDTVAIAKRTGATCITTFELANWLGSQGCAAHPMGIGGSFDFPFGWIKFTIAHHSAGGGELADSYMGTAAGVLIRFGGKLIYHAGDTALTYDMKLIAERFKVDLAFFPIGSNFTMDVDDAVRAVEFVKPRTVVPLHYNTWPPIEADPEDFASKVNNAGHSKAVIMAPNDSIDV